MERLLTYMVLAENDQSLIALIKELHETDTTEVLNQNTLKIITPFSEDEPIDYPSIYELIQTDFDQTIHLLTLYENALNVIDESLILEHLNELPKKVYDLETFIISLIKRKPHVIPILQKRLVKLLGYEMIETVLAIAHSNMNLSTTAKDHYMHRNTLHYRIDKIVDKTSINIKTFKGLSVFTLIFED